MKPSEIFENYDTSTFKEVTNKKEWVKQQGHPDEHTLMYMGKTISMQEWEKLPKSPAESDYSCSLCNSHTTPTKPMKRIVLTQDYYIGIPIEIGTRQKVMWGGKELSITSQETDDDIQIQIDLLGWRSDKEDTTN